MEVRTRFAPSPTGFVHIGSIHNALFAHALAKKNNGKFILRIEDTDQKRFVEGAVEQLVDMLNEFELTPDEGPIQGGPFIPYVQSERLKTGIYKRYAEMLVEKGHAYYCFLTPEELEKFKSSDTDRKAFRSPYRNLSVEEARKRITAGEKYVIRLKVPDDETIKVEDAILGEISWNSNDIDDQVLLKSDGFPTYHLGVVVDDHEMKISHVTRAYEWLPSTPKQILLYRYLGFEQPVFAHSSLLLDPDGGKLSKRKGTVSARKFLEEGYLVDAILNFLMLLGWTPPVSREHGEKEREIFSHEELIRLYELKDRHKSNSIFNRDKLLWFNQQYIKSYSSDKLAEKFVYWLTKFVEDKFLFEELLEDNKKGLLAGKLKLVQERAKTLIELRDLIAFFYTIPPKVSLDIKQLEPIKEKVSQMKAEIIKLIKSYSDDSSTWTNEQWVNDMKAISTNYDAKAGDSFMILRVAVVGTPFSPPLFECIQILGKEEVLHRLVAAA